MEQFKNLLMYLPYNTTIPFVGIYQEKWKHAHRKTCTQMFMALLFIIAKSCRHSKYTSVCEWTNKMLLIHKVAYYEKERDKLLINATKIDKCKIDLLSERNRTYKIAHYVIPCPGIRNWISLQMGMKAFLGGWSNSCKISLRLWLHKHIYFIIWGLYYKIMNIIIKL